MRETQMTVEIDRGSGFCFGVTRAISKAEEELAGGGQLFCLGDIVHNGHECDRLTRMGLVTIDHQRLAQMEGEKVLLRAHGEPPTTYETALRNHIDIVDATCPVVLRLQESIRREYERDTLHARQIVIFAREGHAETLGLVGQTRGTAIVIETPEEAARLDFSRDIVLYSQTTQPHEAFVRAVEYIREHIGEGVTFSYHDTICRQVMGRMDSIRQFARRHDALLFVCGAKSSNGRALFQECLRANAHSHMIESSADISPLWLDGCSSVGVCGATSTPMWLMDECAAHALRLAQGR